jgi:hypothetical protein
MRFSINLNLIFYQYLLSTVRIRFTDWGIAGVKPDGIGRKEVILKKKSAALAALFRVRLGRLLCGGLDSFPLCGGQRDCGCGDVLFEMLEGRGARDRQDNRRVMQEPGEGDL